MTGGVVLQNVSTLICAAERRDMLQRFLLPQDRFHPTPLCTGGNPHPRAVQNGPAHRESAAETASWVPGPRCASTLEH